MSNITHAVKATTLQPAIIETTLSFTKYIFYYIIVHAWHLLAQLLKPHHS